jgi:hypothetical protein
VGRRVLLTLRDLEAYLAAHRVPPRADSTRRRSRAAGKRA